MPLITTVSVTCRAHDQNGNPVAGARFQATLSATETDNGFVVPERIEGVADAAGVCVLELWPNALGVAGSSYQIRAWNPDTGRRFLDVRAVVPNSDCLLEQIIVQEPYPEIDAAEQALIAAQGALAPVTAQAAAAAASATAAGNSATAASGSASYAAESATAAEIAAAAALTHEQIAAQHRLEASGFADDADVSATEASASAAQAASNTATSTTQALNAAASATQSANSATNSATSASASAASATDAFNSASLAASGASTATAQAGIATTRANQAAASAANAAASEVNASTSKNAAALSAVNSATSADASAASAASAAASAVTATNKASDAAGFAAGSASSATVALGHANAADASADSALTSAAEAAASALAAAASEAGVAADAAAAATSATNASNSAQSSANSASAASTSASVAQSSASAAAGSANTATTKASEAATSAASALAIYGSTTDVANAVSAAQAARDTAQGYAAAAAADADQTADDVQATGADAAATAADRAQTGADRVQTGSDAVTASVQAANSATSASEALSSKNAAAGSATAAQADRVQTGLDRVATAADRVQTGLDRAATGADRVQTGTDSATAATKASEAAASATVADTKASEAASSATNAAADRVQSAQSAATSTAQAGIATTQATNAAASAAAANASAGSAAGSASLALAIYGTTAAQQAALTNAQSAASLAQGYALSASSAIQQDLSGVTAQALHRSPNAVTAMFVYDTSKDSDGGAWTEKCQHTSWYNEALNGKWLGAHPSEAYARNEGATLGTELVSNGTFDTSTTGWTTTGTVLVDSSGVTLTNTGATYPSLRQTVAVTSGKVYRLVVKHRQNWTLSGGHFFSFYAGGTEIGASRINFSNTVTQTDVIYVTAPAGATAINFQINADNQDGLKAGTWDNISVREVTALTTASGDYYQSTVDGKFYRLWKNLNTNSTIAPPSNSAIAIAANAGVSFDGTNTATLATAIAATSNSSSNWHSYLVGTGLVGMTHSFYIKHVSGDGLVTGQKGNGDGFEFNCNTGVFITQDSRHAYSITPAANGYFRVSIQALSGSGSNLFVVPKTLNNSFLISGFQTEYGPMSAFEAKVATASVTETFRGNKADFPRLAGIVAEASNVTIYDLTEANRPMWMRFATNGSWNYINGVSLSGLAAVNGLLSVTHTGNGGCLSLLSFAADTVRYFRQSNNYNAAPRAINIASRQFTTAPNAVSEVPPTLNNAVGNAVAMTVLPDAPVDAVTGLQVPTIAVGTGGGLSVIKHDGVVANSTRPYGIYADGLSIAGGYLLFGEGANFSNPNFIKLSAITGTTFTPTLFASNAGPEISNYTQRLTFVGKNSFVTPGANLVLPLRMFRSNFASGAKSTSSRISNAFNTGHLIGDIRRAYLADVDVGSVTGTELVISSDFSSATGWILKTGATISGGVLSINTTGDVFDIAGQTGLLTQNKWYRVTAVCSSYTSGVAFVALADAGTGTRVTVNAAGTFSAVFQHTSSTPDLDIRAFGAGGTGPVVLSLDSVSIVEVVADRSYKAQGANITGTLTKTQVAAAAAQLVAYSGFSAANYLREPYSADLDFGTGEWSASAWVNVPVTMPVGSFTAVGSNLVTNGTFDTDTTGWTVSTSWPVGFTVNAGVATLTYTSSNSGRVTSPIACVVGKTYRVTGSGRVTVGSSAVLSIALSSVGGGDVAAQYISSGTFVPSSFVFVATQTTHYITLRIDGVGVTAEFDSLSVQEINPAQIADRAHSSGPKVNLGVTGGGFLTATAFDGTTTRTVTTTAAYNTATWIKPEAVYTTDGTLAIRVNGVEVSATRGTPLLPLFGRKNLYNFSNDLSSTTWLQVASIGKAVLNVADPFGGTKAIELSWPTQFGALEQTNLPYLLNGQQYTISLWAKRPSGGSNTISVSTGNTGVVLGTYTPTDTWARYSVTFTYSTAMGSIYPIQDRNATGRTNLQVYGPQLELSGVATDYVETGALPSDGHPLTIGNSFAADAPFPGSISLLKLSATVPTAEQSQWMYEQEKQMFRDGAQVTLPDAGSIVDLTYDDATDKWIAVSATNESEWSGLVRTSVTPSPAGSYSKVSASSGVQLLARTTTSPGVDITIPAYGLREELVRRAESAARLNANLATYDYVGGFTANTTTGNTAIISVANLTYPVSYIGARISGTGIPANTTIVAVSGTTIYLSAAATATATGVAISFVDFILPVGMTAKEVSLAGAAQREGATAQYTRLFDGFKESIRFGTAPSNTALIQIQAARSAA